jgi:HEAT repeat protein
MDAVGAGSRGSGQGAGSGETTSDEASGDASGDGPRDGRGSGSGVLRGAELTTAVRDALDAEDLGALQGLLISGLTKDGTRFTPEDVPALFDALLNVHDYGMEKLVLTHLERLEAPPEDLAQGYSDYLTSSRNPQHADEAFQQLVRIGGDASFDALSGIVDSVDSSRLARRAVEALGELGDPRAVPILRRQLYATSEPSETRSYTTALAKLGSPEAVSSLVEFVSREGRESSLAALREIRDKSAAPVLAASLSERSVTPAYQRAALSSLRTLREPESLQGLDRFLGKAEGSVLRDTIETIGRIPDPRAARILDSYASRQADARLAAQAERAAQRVRARIEVEAQRAAAHRAAAAGRG